MIAVIVPAHNEQGLISQCLESITIAAAHPGLQGEEVRIVVTLDACSDATAKLCSQHGVDVVAIQARCVGVARGAAATRAIALGARWIASTDADTIVPPDWLWRQTGCGAEAFCGVVEVVDWLDYPPGMMDAFASRERVEDGHRHIHGANLGLSAAAYRAVGGFSALSTGEDVALVKDLQRAGFSIAWHGRPSVVTSARRSARAPKGFSGFLHALEREVMEASALLSSARILPQ